MHELLHGSSGELLEHDAYWTGFDRDYWRLGEPGFWKLERRQEFQDPTMPSWQAFARGDWDEAIRLGEALRPDIEAEYREDAEHGIRSWWVKVVEKPITPYIQWAFHVLRIRAQSGERMRVVREDQVRQFEKHQMLPEMVTLGSDVMYDLVYDDAGRQQGGIRIVDRAVIARCQRFIADLYAVGEDAESFFQREIAGLAPPLSDVRE
ncbi:DUF6879 family protein [Amycolatopsis sp. NPDC059027]|uniref:DUF6879 family protein n=1 Tax=unclassified Amycolatopsis TaxID=2618356 RepID=UPI0036734026